MNIIIGITPILLGIITVKLFLPKIHEFEKLGLGFLIGSSLFTIALFLAGVVGFSISLKTGVGILGTSSIILIGYLFYNKRARNNLFKWKFETVKLGKVEYLAIIILGVLFASSLISNIYWPVKSWDALTLYDFRGKYFADTGRLSDLFSIHRYYLGYPLFTSLAHAWIYIIGFKNPSFFYSLFYIALTVVFCSSLTRLTNFKYSLIFTLVLAFSYEIYSHSLFAYTNLPYIVFLVLGYIYLYYWKTSSENKYLYLSALLLSLSGWVRNSDPFWMVPLIVTFYYLVKSKKYWLWVKYTLIVLSFRIPWSVYVKIISRNFIIGSSNDYSSLFSLGLNEYITRFVLVSEYFFTNVFKPNWIMIVSFIAGLILVLTSKLNNIKFFSYLILISLGIIFGGIYFYSLIYVKWQLVGDSVARMSMFIIPLVIFFQALLLYNYLNPRR